MCGIIAYKGKRNSTEIILEGLKDLEYRGYDSWGISSINNKNNEIEIIKNTGKISSIKIEDLKLQESNTAIAHTRWSTHGKVTKENAHPHFSEKNTFALAQNGIVENFQEIKKDLIQKGYTFKTETDTEVIVKLIEEELKEKELKKEQSKKDDKNKDETNNKDITNKDVKNNEIQEALRSALKKIKGRNAIVLIEKEKKRIIAASKNTQLILGIGQDELILASDITPLLKHTNKIIFLEDNEIITIENYKEYKIYNAETNKELKKEPETINWSPEQAKKGNYTHFMLKEILEQKHTIKQALIQDPEQIKQIANEINNAFGIYAVGCGTAGKVCLAGTYAFAKIAQKHINFAFGSEFPYFNHFIVNKSLLLAISQSGETADTLEAIKTVSNKKGKIISIVNAMGSTITRKSDYTILLNNGPEIAVASTKATTSQLALMILLAYTCAGKYEEGLEKLTQTSENIEKMLDDKFLKNIKKLAEKIKNSQNIYIIGRGINYAMALESAIKIQEVSYIHAEGFAGGELKHGPIALIEEGTPCIVLVANDETKTDILNNAIEIKTRGSYIIGISPENNEIFNYWIKVPNADVTSAITNIIPIQLLAYYLAVAKNIDPDKPRNLAKSVTVK